MTVKPKRKVIGSITGEVFETTGKTGRRRLPDGRTETGKEISSKESMLQSTQKGVEKAPEPIKGNIEILVDEDDDGLDWQPATQIIDEMPPTPTGTIDIGEMPEEKPKRKGPQTQKTTKKDMDKMEDLFFAIGCAMDDKNYTGEEKAMIVSKLFAGATDVRVETAEFVLSARMFGLVAGCVAVAVLLKGQSGGLFSNYRRVLAGLAPQQTKVDDDTLWEGK